MQYFRFHDLIAAVATVGLLSSIIALALMSRPVPTEIASAFSAALAWTFRGTAEAANHFSARRRNNAHDGP